MRISSKKTTAAVAAISSLALAGGGIANAATAHHKRVRHATSTTAAAGSSETALMGATLTSASAAAIAAVPGGTVKRASIENPADTSGAAYEVHVTKADGSQVDVLEDSSFKVLSVTAGQGRGGRGGPGGGNPNETVLTGTSLTQASDAAIAAVPGGTVERASAEDKSDTSGAAYEVHVTQSDGSHVQVLEDSSFKVLSVTAGNGHGGQPSTSTTTGQ